MGEAVFPVIALIKLFMAVLWATGNRKKLQHSAMFSSKFGSAPHSFNRSTDIKVSVVFVSLENLVQVLSEKFMYFH